jgi:hypothetical protein
MKTLLCCSHPANPWIDSRGNAPSIRNMKSEVAIVNQSTPASSTTWDQSATSASLKLIRSHSGGATTTGRSGWTPTRELGPTNELVDSPLPAPRSDTHADT